MKRPLNVLIVEDSQDDADLLVHELRAAGLHFNWKRVETEGDFLTGLAARPDIVLSDYSLPQFSGLRAAQLTKESGLEIPFILISGTVGEEAAVEAMKHGATDYLLKDRLTRLGQAVGRALREAEQHAERQQTLGQLRESEEKFRQLAENISEVFWITEPAKAKMIYISPAYEVIWGRTCQSLYDSPQTWLNAIHPEDRDRILQASLTKQESGNYDETYRIQRPDGSIRWVHDKAFPVRNEKGEIYRIVGVAKDITDRRKLEEQFRQAQKMEAIGRLAGGVAHDFNNILAVIQINGELIKAEGELNPAQKECADGIGEATQRATALIRQLLLFSRREIMLPRHLDLNRSINNLTKMLRRILGEDIQIQFRFFPEPLFVHADPGMMDQVLMNLIVNSRDAMSKGGRLVIETSSVELDEASAAALPHARAGSFAVLTVTDTGCGIPPENLALIFEPFFTTKGAGQGTGLGLATVFGIVQQHQGWINVQSEEGKGTAFRIYLPRLAEISELESATRPAETLPRGHETILLVEDDKPVRVSVRAALSRLGYRVLEATDGADALKSWVEHRTEIKLLITDMVIPGGMTGKELVRRMAASDPELKVIYVSGYSAEAAGSNFPLEDGINFLAKPFQIPKLAQTVRARLDG